LQNSGLIQKSFLNIANFQITSKRIYNDVVFE
jgi:hypothetical protein